MTFQFIVEYIDPKEAALPFDFNYYDQEYDDYASRRLIHSKRVRAKNSEQAIEIFQQKYPELEPIRWSGGKYEV